MNDSKYYEDYRCQKCISSGREINCGTCDVQKELDSNKNIATKGKGKKMKNDKNPNDNFWTILIAMCFMLVATFGYVLYDLHVQNNWGESRPLPQGFFREGIYD